MFLIYRIYKHISTVSNCVFLTPIISDYYLMLIFNNAILTCYDEYAFFPLDPREIVNIVAT